MAPRTTHQALVRVTFILDGAERTVDFDPAALQYRRHSERGSLLDVALNFDIPL